MNQSQPVRDQDGSQVAVVGGAADDHNTNLFNPRKPSSQVGLTQEI